MVKKAPKISAHFSAHFWALPTLKVGFEAISFTICSQIWVESEKSPKKVGFAHF